jgi:uncharacterized sulfatase
VLNRRTFLASSLAAPLLAAPKRPNILLIVMDDFGIGNFAPHAATLKTSDFDPAYVQFLKDRKVPYDPAEALEMSQRAMPNLTAMSKQGVVFNKAIAPSNLCSPARAGIFTGQNPNRFGIYNNIDFNKTGLPRGSMLVEQLQKSGYATAMIGKYHVGTRDLALRDREQAEGKKLGFEGSILEEHHPLHYGFDYYFGYNHHQCPFYNSEQIWENRTYIGKSPEYNTELFTDKALSFAASARKADKPYFIELAMHAVHGPLKPPAPEKYLKHFNSKSAELNTFYSHVHAVDAAIGRIRDTVGAEEWSNTLLMFTGDNGAPVSISTPLPGNAPHRGHKGNYFLGGIRIPMMMHWPNAIKSAKNTKALVSSIDVMPTALEAAGLKAPATIDGRSLLPLAKGASKIREALIVSGIHARSWGYTGATTIAENPEKRREESPGAWVVTDGDYILRFTGTVIPGLFKDAEQGAPAKLELFDLREDPQEQRDLSQQLPNVVARMKKRYEAEAKSFPAPPVWRRDRWAELLQGRDATANIR